MEGPSKPSGALVALITAPVVIGDLFTWIYFGIGCGVAENSSQVWIDFCEARYGLLPAAGAVATLVLGAWALIKRRPRLLWLGVGVGVASALTLWILWGDPAGNFNGILTS